MAHGSYEEMNKRFHYGKGGRNVIKGNLEL